MAELALARQAADAETPPAFSPPPGAHPHLTSRVQSSLCRGASAASRIAASGSVVFVVRYWLGIIGFGRQRH